MSVPNLFALSAMSIIAISATSAALAVSPPKLLKSDAEKLVTCDIYSLADRPAVLNAASALALTTLAFSLNNVSTPPMLCSSAAPSITAPPTTAVATIVTGIATVAAKVLSLPLIADIPLAVASFSLTIGEKIFPPNAFSFPVIFVTLEVIASFNLITGVVTFFATPVNAFFIDFTFDVAESFILMTGVATFFPTVLIPLLTFVIVALAASFALMTGDITVFPNCFTFPVSPSVFLVADSVLILAV